MSKPVPIYRLKQEHYEYANGLIQSYLKLVIRCLNSHGWVYIDAIGIPKKFVVGTGSERVVPEVLMFTKGHCLDLKLNLADVTSACHIDVCTDHIPQCIDVIVTATSYDLITSTEAHYIRQFRWMPNFFSHDDTKVLVKEIKDQCSFALLEMEAAATRKKYGI